MLTLAHAGHWLASLRYVVPIVVVVGSLVWMGWREKRRADSEDAPRS